METTVEYRGYIVRMGKDMETIIHSIHHQCSNIVPMQTGGNLVVLGDGRGVLVTQGSK